MNKQDHVVRALRETNFLLSIVEYSDDKRNISNVLRHFKAERTQLTRILFFRDAFSDY